MTSVTIEDFYAEINGSTATLAGLIDPARPRPGHCVGSRTAGHEMLTSTTRCRFIRP